MTTTNEHRNELDQLDITGLQNEVARLRRERDSIMDTAIEENGRLRAENEALRAVAVAAARLADIVNVGQTYTQDLAMEASLELAEIAHEELSEKIAAARNAGYLAGEEVGA